jgi:DnaJ like chaperone protein
MRQMQLDARQKEVAQHLFNEGKKAGFPVNDVLQQFRMECHRRRNLLQMFMEIQIAIALSDGTLDRNESRILEDCAGMLGFSLPGYRAILQRIQAQRHAHSRHQPGMSLADAYKLLAVDSSASDQEVKKAYRRQMNQHHPDKLVSKGLPEEMMELANKKVQDIKTAYDTIKASRNN